ncbi:MAG: NlpC/P60 family protein [Verrucomicrobiota bacterium]
MLRLTLYAALCVLISAVQPLSAQLTKEQFTDLIETTRWIESHRIGYAEECKLPGESETWVMDCSNTSRYLYKRALGIELPRVASGQYWVLDQEGLVYQAREREDGSVDQDHLIEQLASGDLLFWEWTYDIKRRPPITHVMIYLGKNKQGQPMMVGSSSRKNGGVGIYPFDPNAPMGGVRGFFGGWKHKAKFVGYGRPLAKQPKETQLAARD